MPARWNFNTIDDLPRTVLSRGRMFSRARSDTPTLLFVHGGFHGAWCWTLFLEFFAQRGISVAAVDLSGHGGQEPDADFLRYGIQAAAADVDQAAEILGGKLVLVGHSLGALIAMAAAERLAPAGLVMLAPSPPGQLSGLRKLPERPADRPVPPPGEDRARSWFLSGYTGADISEFMARLCAESPAMINDSYRLGITTKAEWIKGPSLCLAADRDDRVHHPPGQDAAVAEFYGADFQMIPKSGHCLMLDDQWEGTAGLILAWLQEKRLARAGI